MCVCQTQVYRRPAHSPKCIPSAASGWQTRREMWLLLRVRLFGVIDDQHFDCRGLFFELPSLSAAVKRLKGG